MDDLPRSRSCSKTQTRLSRSWNSWSCIQNLRKRPIRGSQPSRILVVYHRLEVLTATLEAGLYRGQPDRDVLRLVSQGYYCRCKEPTRSGLWTFNQLGIDAGNISYGVTCPFGAQNCQAADGAAQFIGFLLGKSPLGSPKTYMDTPSDNASIQVGQAMRKAGCHS
jgi:hypothetical protein